MNEDLMFEQPLIDVLIKLDSNNNIIQIGSSIFITDTTDYIIIDSGEGNKYAHAQNQYLPNSLVDEYGRFNYQWKNNKLIEVKHGEFVPEPYVPTRYVTEEQYNNDVAMLEFNNILLEDSVATVNQSLADLEFNLIIGGVI